MAKWKLVAVMGVGMALGALATMRAQQDAAKPGTLTALDYIQIQQLVAKYSYALDTGAGDGYMYADLFASDGYMMTGGRQVKGREDLGRLARINPNPPSVGRDGQPVDTTAPSMWPSSPRRAARRFRRSPRSTRRTG